MRACQQAGRDVSCAMRKSTNGLPRGDGCTVLRSRVWRLAVSSIRSCSSSRRRSVYCQSYHEGPMVPSQRPGGPSEVSGLTSGVQGSWKLVEGLNETLQSLLGTIDTSMKEALFSDLSPYPLNKWKFQGWDFLDSMNVPVAIPWGPPPKNQGNIQDPKEGEAGYPRLLIENQLFCSRVFRKLHLEVASRQDGLTLLHMVMYPRYSYDLPILGLDLVEVRGRYPLAILDCFPLHPDMQLPDDYKQQVLELQDSLLSDVPNCRQLPDWGEQLFSSSCVCLQPGQDMVQVQAFIQYAAAVIKKHLEYSSMLSPLPRSSTSRRSALLHGHQQFCATHLANAKVQDMMAQAFGPRFTQKYLKQLMFDFDPEDNPPYLDENRLQVDH